MAKTTSKLVSDTEGAALCGVSRRTFRRWDSNGTLGPKSLKLGRLRRWRRDQIEAWIQMDCPKRRTYREQTKGETNGSSARDRESAMEAA